MNNAIYRFEYYIIFYDVRKLIVIKEKTLILDASSFPSGYFSAPCVFNPIFMQNFAHLDIISGWSNKLKK